jgi:1,2-diacylglycerol 3-alpha-glucosyltransferase
MKTKIAILVPNFAKYSGDARVVKSQAKEFAQNGNYVAIFTLAADMEPPEDVDIFVIGMPKSLFWQRVYRLLFPLDVFRVLKWFPKLKHFELVIAHLYPMTWLAYLAKKFYKVEYVFWFHGMEDPKLFSRAYERWYMKLHILLTKFTTKNADKAVAVSKFAKMMLEEFTGLDSEVVYNKVDTSRFQKGLDGSKIRQKYDIGEAPVILSVGRIVPQKGFDLLIQAFKIVKENIPNVKLVLVGEPTFDYYFQKLKENSDDSVIFNGSISESEIPYYYAMCDVYATCSLWENHNLPVLEAQTCGKPVVSFDIDAFKEEVDENGVLVEKGNVGKFAQACIDKLREVRNCNV